MSGAVKRAGLLSILVAAAGVVFVGLRWGELDRSWTAAWMRLVQEPQTPVSAEPSEPQSPVALPRAPGRKTALPQGTGLGWPTLLGPMHDGTSPERGLRFLWSEAGPLEKWRIEVGTGYTAPIAAGDALVLLHRREDREMVECFDAETGATRWQRSWPANYVGKHHYSTGPYSTPVIDDGRVYAIGASGRLCCLHLNNGAEVWHRKSHDEYRVTIDVWPAAASPLVEGDRLILNLGGRETGAGVVALDKATGRTLWTATRDGASGSMPRAATIHGQRHVFVWTAEALLSIDPADGKVRWRIPFAANNHEAAHGTTPLVAGDRVLVSGYQIGNLCVRVLPGGSYEELWRDKREVLDSQYNNLIQVGDGCVCGFSSTRRKLRCLDLATGSLQWEWRSRIPNGTMIAVEGHFLLAGENGLLASLRISDHGVTLVSMTKRRVLNAPCLAYPTLSNGLLYLRNEEEMVAIDLRRDADAKPFSSISHESLSRD